MRKWIDCDIMHSVCTDWKWVKGKVSLCMGGGGGLDRLDSGVCPSTRSRGCHLHRLCTSAHD